MINQIGKITIYVNNQEEAKKFWVEQAGFVVKAEIPMGPNMTWLEVGPSAEAFTSFILYEKALMLAQKKDANVAHPSIILSTTDIEGTYVKLNENGVRTTEIKAMPYGKMFSFFDQDSNIYMLREDK